MKKFTMTGAADNSNIVAQLKALHLQWCQDAETKKVDNLEENATTPLDWARETIGNAALSDGLIKTILAFLVWTLGEASDINSNAVKLKQIQWHVTMILELWGKVGNDTWIEKCTELLEGAQKRTGCNSKKRRSSPNPIKGPKSVLGKTLLLQHLVNTMSSATFLLPFGTSLSSFLSQIIQKRHHDTIPDVVLHLYNAFESPNPFRESASDGDETYGYGFLSIAAGNTVPLLESSANVNEEKNSANTSAAPRKRQRDKNSVAQKQQRKQQVLTSLKQNRFKTTTNCTTHFHSKFEDISKLLDKKASTAPASVALQNHSKKRPNTTPAAVDQTTKRTKNVSVITPHPSKGTGKGSSNNARSKIQQASSNFVAKSVAKDSTTKHVTIRDFTDDQNLPISPPTNHDVTVASTPPTQAAQQNLKMPRTLGKGVIGETPTKIPPWTQALEDSVVGETPVMKRSQSMALETPAGVGPLDMGSSIDDDESFEQILPPAGNAKPAAVQPIKLFGAIRPKKAKLPVAGANKAGPVVDKKKKSSGIKSIQMARALLRRKSI